MQIGPYEAILNIITRLGNLIAELKQLVNVPNVKDIMDKGRPVKDLAFKQGF